MKRTAAAVIALGMMAGLAACSSDSAPTAGSGEPAGPITVWIMGDSGANFEKLVAPFTQKTGTQVKVVAIPWDGIDERLTTAVASGRGPDVLQVGLSKLRTFADAGALLPLDAELSGRPALASGNFADGVAGKATAVNDRIVSVPWVSDTRVLFYRKDILAKAGINEPPKTWEQLRADAKTLTARGKGQYGYYVPQWDSALPVMMTWAYGGDIIGKDGAVNFDTPAFNRAVDLYTGLYADGSVPTNGDFDQAQGFISGVAPMLVSGPYLAKSIADTAPELNGQWGVAKIPGADAGTSLFAGSSMAIWHKTTHKNAALDLLSYLSEPATQVAWYQASGELPTVKTALSDTKLTGDPLVQVYAQQLVDAKVLPMVPNWDGGVGADLLKALNSIALNEADRTSTLTSLFDKTRGVSL